MNPSTSLLIERRREPSGIEASRLYFLALVANALSIRRRIASDREGLSFCCLAQFSMANRVLGGSCTVRTGSCPVAGRPRFFGVTVIDFLAISVLRKNVQRADGKLQLPTGPNPSHGGKPWPRLILFLPQFGR